MPNQINTMPESWKQEVNRRVAAHRNRKGPISVEPAAAAHRPASSRAAEVLARVNARYAHAPSYNDVLASEARNAVLAAEAASRAAAEAHVAAQNLLAGLEAARQLPETEQASPERLATPTLVPPSTTADSTTAAPTFQSYTPTAEAASLADGQPLAYEVRWQDALPARREEAAANAREDSETYEIIPEGWQEPRQQGILEPDGVEIVEAGQAIPGNLIEFPRELVAPRRMRPRLAEGVLAAATEPEAQLSIFEVDPAAVSQVCEPPAVEPAAASDETSSIWTRPEWQKFELSAEPEEEYEPLPAPRQPEAPAIEGAPASMRIMASVVNFSLVGAAFLGAAYIAAQHGLALANMRNAEIGALAGLSLIAVLYTAVFYVLGDGTPGMRYAHMRLANFEGRRTSRRERLLRLGALALSILPLGLGLLWMIFDEDRLCWHDRLSRTYLRRY